jgi:hypothetical protein
MGSVAMFQRRWRRDSLAHRCCCGWPASNCERCLRTSYPPSIAAGCWAQGLHGFRRLTKSNEDRGCPDEGCRGRAPAGRGPEAGVGLQFRVVAAHVHPHLARRRAGEDRPRWVWALGKGTSGNRRFTLRRQDHGVFALVEHAFGDELFNCGLKGGFLLQVISKPGG